MKTLTNYFNRRLITISGLVSVTIASFLFVIVGMGCKNFGIVPAQITTTPRKVEIRNTNGAYTLYKNNQPFLVKGGAGFEYLEDLKASGGNTISTWDTTNFEYILNNAALHNVAVILGLDIPDSKLVMEFYGDKKMVKNLFKSYGAIVNKYKGHPALLAWSLGNELHFASQPKYLPFYKYYNDLLDSIHSIDPDHPITTNLNYLHINIINIQIMVSGLDFISFNIYNSLHRLDEELAWVKWCWKGPYLVGEWSPNGGWEANKTKWDAAIEFTSTKRSSQAISLYKKFMPVKDPRFLGSLFFYWGNRQEYTHTWFSVFHEDGTPNELKEALQDCWNDTLTIHQAAHLEYMLVDSLGALDNILLSSGSKHSASLRLPPGQPTANLRYSWEIVREDWWGTTNKHLNLGKPTPETGLLIDSTTQAIHFSAPRREGPYRVFVTVYNDKGYCTTANTPFYVIN